MNADQVTIDRLTEALNKICENDVCPVCNSVSVRVMRDSEGKNVVNYQSYTTIASLQSAETLDGLLDNLRAFEPNSKKLEEARELRERADRLEAEARKASEVPL